jgi:hypothetical protein
MRLSDTNAQLRSGAGSFPDTIDTANEFQRILFLQRAFYMACGAGSGVIRNLTTTQTTPPWQ